MVPFIGEFRNEQVQDTESRFVVDWGWAMGLGRGQWERLSVGVVFLSGMTKVF